MSVVLGLEPTFDSASANVTVTAGQTALLPCFITYLGKYKVSCALFACSVCVVCMTEICEMLAPDSCMWLPRQTLPVFYISSPCNRCTIPCRIFLSNVSVKPRCRRKVLLSLLPLCIDKTIAISYPDQFFCVEFFLRHFIVSDILLPAANVYMTAFRHSLSSRI